MVSPVSPTELGSVMHILGRVRGLDDQHATGPSVFMNPEPSAASLAPIETGFAANDPVQEADEELDEVKGILVPLYVVVIRFRGN